MTWSAGRLPCSSFALTATSMCSMTPAERPTPPTGGPSSRHLLPSATAARGFTAIRRGPSSAPRPPASPPPPAKRQLFVLGGVEAALASAGQFRIALFPADLVVEPDLDRWRIDFRIVERAGGDIHMVGARRAAIADETPAILAVEPFD